MQKLKSLYTNKMHMKSNKIVVILIVVFLSAKAQYIPKLTDLASEQIARSLKQKLCTPETILEKSPAEALEYIKNALIKLYLEPQHILREQTGLIINECAYSNDGTLIIVVPLGQQITLIDVTKKSSYQRIVFHELYTIKHLALSPNKRFILGVCDNHCVLYDRDNSDADDNPGLSFFTNNPVSSVEFTPDSNFCLLGLDSGDIEIRSITAIDNLDEIERIEEPHTTKVTTLSISPEGLVASGSLDCIVKIATISDKKVIASVDLNNKSNEGISTLKWRPSNNSIAIGTEQGNIYTWNIDTESLYLLYTNPDNKPIGKLAFSPNGNALIFSIYDKLYHFNFSTQSTQEIESGHDNLVTALAFDNLNKAMITTSYDSKLLIWPPDISLTATEIIRNT
jgi:WD40 repeat protein